MKKANVWGPTVPPRPRMVPKTVVESAKSLLFVDVRALNGYWSINTYTQVDTVFWQQMSRGRISTLVIYITDRVPLSKLESGELVGLYGVVSWHRLRVHCYSLLLVPGGFVLPLIHRGKAACPRSRSNLVLACVDDAWYGKLSFTFGCPAKEPWLSAVKTFTWGCWSQIGSPFCSI